MPQKKNGRRPMTFTACWTCKRRKVKCDERPKSCRNCERLHLPCDGYGIKLQWRDESAGGLKEESMPSRNGRIKLGRSSPPNAASRQRPSDTEVMWSPEPSWSSNSQYSIKAIDELLDLIECDVASRQSLSQRGPFTAFLGTHASDTAALPAMQCHDLVGKHYALDESSPIHDAWSDVSDLISTGTKAHKMIDSPECVMETDKSTYNEVIQSVSPSSAIQSPNWLSFSPRHSELEDESQYLLHHYVVHIAGLLIPLEHPMNPYRNLYVPAALAAASLGETSLLQPSDRSIVDSVLLYSLLSSASFHRWNCAPEQTKFHHLGSQHRQKALHLLQSALAGAASGMHSERLLMAMLSLVSVDVMSGCEADFSIHLQGTQQLRSMIVASKETTRTIDQLSEISEFLSLLARSVRFGLPSSISTGRQSTYPESKTSISRADSCVSYMYGVTPAIAASIQDACVLAEDLQSYQADDTPPPESLLRRREQLSQFLLSWSFDSEFFALSAIDNVDMLDIFRHHAEAWHQAALIYFNRRVSKSPSSSMMTLIDRVARKMHAVEDIKARSKLGASVNMAPITWPAFVASCEAIDREPWKAWWRRVQCYKIANIKLQWKVVQLVWRQRDQLDVVKSSHFDWSKAVQTMNLSLLPI